ncbi:MAG: low-specificity L-threonine aldolase [Betaproteobacteria bacterium]|jgi:threonine aldolase
MSERLIDMRSDTVTRPTPAMREAMLRAEVGDDVMAEDPTINALQERVAALFGKEAALFVSSGTQANQISIKAYTQPGDEVIADAICHPVRSELGASALISGVQVAMIPTVRGVYTREAAAKLIRADHWMQPKTSLLWVENTHNAGGGTVFPLDALDGLRALSNERGIPLHIDGARIFNAVVASGIAPAEWGRRCDSLSFCLSKGLGCPVGSMLMGTREFIKRARRLRQIYGGGWRQAGILAAAGLHALDHHVERMAEDHANAKWFAERVSAMQGVELVYADTQTNLVFLDVAPSGLAAETVSQRLRERGVALAMRGGTTFRAVTHLDVTRADVEQAARALQEALA